MRGFYIILIYHSVSSLNSGITTRELYKKWTKKYFKGSSAAYQCTVESAWTYCTSVYDMQSKDLRSKQIKKEALNLKSEHKPHDPKWMIGYN